MSSLDLFSVQVFFIILRETIELAIIISVLLAFVTKSLQDDSKSAKISPQSSNSTKVSEKSLLRTLRLQIWLGGLAGFVTCLFVGTIILAVFYTLGNDLWASTEHYWEGVFSVVASIVISVMGVKIMRVNRMQQKWKHKLSAVMDQSNYLGVATKSSTWSEKNTMFILPFVTTLREGLEAIVFVGGIGINENTSIVAIVNAGIVAMAIGSCVGMVLYRSGNTLSLQWFLILSSCFLYLVAAGLFSKGVWNFELQHFIDLCDGFDVSETGHGPGSYDITTSVWHVNCCNGQIPDDGVFWMLFTAIFGWTNSATYGSVVGYNLYWVGIICMFSFLFYEEKHGHLPFVPLSWQQRRIRKNCIALPRTSTDSVDSATPLI